MSPDLQQALTIAVYVLIALVALYVIWVILFLTFFRKIWKRAAQDPSWNRTTTYRGRR